LNRRPHAQFSIKLLFLTCIIAEHLQDGKRPASAQRHPVYQIRRFSLPIFFPGAYGAQTGPCLWLRKQIERMAHNLVRQHQLFCRIPLSTHSPGQPTILGGRADSASFVPSTSPSVDATPASLVLRSEGQAGRPLGEPCLIRINFFREVDIHNDGRTRHGQDDTWGSMSEMAMLRQLAQFHAARRSDNFRLADYPSRIVASFPLHKNRSRSSRAAPAGPSGLCFRPSGLPRSAGKPRFPRCSA
jgi:hypothetical protein